MKYLVAVICLMGLISPTFAQESRGGQQESVADGIALTVRGYATDYDRFVLVLVPTLESEGNGNFLPPGEEKRRYQAVQQAIARALAPFGLTTQVRATAETSLAPMAGVGYSIGFLLPQKFDGKNLGSGTIAEVMSAAVKAGALSSGQLHSSYSAERAGQARRDAVADAVKAGQAEAKEIAGLVGQRVGKLLGVRTDNSLGTLGGPFGVSTRLIDATGIIAEPFANNSVFLAIRFAIK